MTLQRTEKRREASASFCYSGQAFAEAGGGCRVSVGSLLMQVNLGEDREGNANE